MNVVTGAFGYTGKYITSRLLSMGETVRTLTNHPGRQNPFGEKVSFAPFNFDRRTELVESLRGATTLYNTYWVRFPQRRVTYDKAIENTNSLIEAAEEAGVHRMVHISITNASEGSPLPYFAGKGLLETAIVNSSLSYGIIRPTVIFGTEDILINNIAWILRRFPVFTIPGQGDYRLQPVYVGDVADIAVEAGYRSDDVIIDAVGPEVYTYEQLVQIIAREVRSQARIVHVAPGTVLLLSRLVGYLVRDVIVTQEEVRGLMSSLLVSPGPPTGNTLLSEWLEDNAGTLGKGYASELARHYR